MVEFLLNKSIFKYMYIYSLSSDAGQLKDKHLKMKLKETKSLESGGTHMILPVSMPES